MNVEVAIIDISERGVRVSVGDSSPFWLPRGGPGIEWAAKPEIGAVVYVRVPAWLANKHRPLQELRYQRAFSYQAPVGLDPEKAKDSIPMAADSNDLRGALFRNDKKESDRHPDYRGDIVIDGQKYWLSGWIKEGKRGKFLSLAAKLAEEQRQQPAPANTYAAATGRNDRQRQPDRGGPDFGGDSIPF